MIAVSTPYNPWPIGKLPKELQRPEPEIIRSMGYEWTDAREIITLLESKVAEFAGSKYAVAVDCCTHAIELSFRYIWQDAYRRHKFDLTDDTIIYLPRHTYVSAYFVPQHLGFSVSVIDNKWTGGYHFTTWPDGYHQENFGVFDGAVRWKRGMYEKETLHCLSFQIKKRIPIGRGGMILTDDKEAADWLRLAGYDGRDLTLPYDHPDHVKMPGYHYYMTPEDAARGIILMDSINEEGDSADWTNYPDLRKMLKL